MVLHSPTPHLSSHTRGPGTYSTGGSVAACIDCAANNCSTVDDTPMPDHYEFSVSVTRQQGPVQLALQALCLWPASVTPVHQVGEWPPELGSDYAVPQALSVWEAPLRAVKRVLSRGAKTYFSDESVHHSQIVAQCAVTSGECLSCPAGAALSGTNCANCTGGEARGDILPKLIDTQTPSVPGGTKHLANLVVIVAASRCAHFSSTVASPSSTWCSAPRTPAIVSLAQRAVSWRRTLLVLHVKQVSGEIR